ncbi:MAG: diguanylate cyclase [Atopobiaceae bacterium]|nr:diguanylate cyclase [Atopobiaceae bacterium]
MWQFTSDIVSFDDFEVALGSLSEREEVASPHALLFQIFTSSCDPDHADLLRRKVLRRFPQALIIGSSTSGEIAGDAIHERTVAFTALAFDSADVYVASYDCSRIDPSVAGASLRERVMRLGGAVGVEVLSTTKGMDTKSFVAQLDSLPEGIEVFGGGADAWNDGGDTIVFDAEGILGHGAVAAIFCGESLHVATSNALGWKPLSKAMEITGTRSGGKTLVSVNGRPATDVYEKYLGAGNDDDFHRNVQEFPILVERDGNLLTRVPISSERDGSIILGADVAEGESLRISYADPAEILHAAYLSARQVATFGPQALLAFCCITRKVFLKEHAGCDTRLFSDLAPVAGFYTYGEILRSERSVEVFNCSLVVAGMREGEAAPRAGVVREPDGLLQGHLALVQHLVHFVGATMEDLERANAQLETLASQDRLTGLLNRGEIEARLADEAERTGRGDDVASVIMIDIDDFKLVNDRFGHGAGDFVLVSIARLLERGVREYDAVGRWGGEEFFVILYGTDQRQATATAERIRKSISGHDFGRAGHVTASVGVAQARLEDTATSLYHRVDTALYEAKSQGKDRVAVG